MSQSNVEEAAPVSDYELDQYFPRRRELTAGQVERLREQHGFVRVHFLTHPERYRSIQRWLTQAQRDVTYDIYLARSAKYAAAATVFGLGMGVFLTSWLASMGAFAALDGIVDPGGLPSALTETVGDFRVPLVGLVLSLLSAAAFGGGTWLARYYYPRFVVDARRREINVLLPHAIVYMYALSHGGMTVFEVVEELADADDVYGEVANEFDVIVRDVELFGNDLFTAIRDARNLTPSDNVEQFLDDMLSVLDSGTDLSAFLKTESQTYMVEARQQQDDFLKTLSIFSEVFVVAFVAAPLFLIVTLLVVGLLGSDALPQLSLLVYVFIPVGMVGFLVLLDLLSKPYADTAAELDLDEEHDPEPSVTARQAPLFEAYERRKRRDALREIAEDPLDYVERQHPLLTTVVTVPAAVVLVALLAAVGAVPVSPEAAMEHPIGATIGAGVVPFFVVAVPITALYERQHRRERTITKRFPDLLNILSSANEMGIRLTDSLDLVTRWSEGVLASELQKVRNDIAWNGRVGYALLAFANRLRAPQITRTMKLIAEGNRSSGDLSRIISIAAEDTRNRYRLERQRRSEMNAYVAIVVIGFLVYLAVVVLLHTSYLEPIGRMSSEATTSGNTDLLNVSSISVVAYQTVFFHSALVQAVGSGLIAGKLAENELLAGLKYSLGLVTLAVVVFVLI